MRTAAALAALLVAVVAFAELPPDCRFGAGALPEETLPAGLPHGDQIPIDHILVLMQENRSFDHYFSQLNIKNVDRARKTMSNPDPTGGPPIHPFHQKEYCEVADLIRVPFVAVSPFARKHYVSHTTTDQTAILRFVETRFDLPALTRRDANASPLLELFDFDDPPFMKPPRLPDPKIYRANAQRCVQILAGDD
jgi:phospholipase C